MWPVIYMSVLHLYQFIVKYCNNDTVTRGYIWPWRNALVPTIARLVFYDLEIIITDAYYVVIYNSYMYHVYSFFMIIWDSAL